MTRTLDIIAGGKGIRIRDEVNVKVGVDAPKHLLPLPARSARPQSLLSAIVTAGADYFTGFRVHVRNDAAATIDEALSAQLDIPYEIVIDRHLTGPLGPFARMLRAGEVMYFAGGDAYCTWDWANLVRYHESHPLPVTALFARTTGCPGGARVSTRQDEDGGHLVVAEWERVAAGSPDDLMNIGAYVFDGTPEVIDILTSQPRHTEDNVLGTLAKQGLLSAYVSPEPGFNVNTRDVYQALLAHLHAA